MTDTRVPLFPLFAASLVALSASARDISTLDLSVHEEDITPAVTLREHDNRVVEEFRVNNRLYMVKVTPSVGAPYYLVDEDGSGDMAWHRGTSRVEQSVPQWTLMSW